MDNTQKKFLRINLSKNEIVEEIIDENLYKKAESVKIDYLRLNSLHGPLAHKIKEELNKVVSRIAIKTKAKEEAEKLSPEIAPFILNGPPGACFFGGRAKPTEVFAL